MKRAIFLAIILTTFFIPCSAQQKKTNNFRSPFRYVIVSNKIDPPVNKKDEKRRFVEVLLDKKAFTKENLITLFQLVSKRFPKPSVLFVNVYTDLEDVETPDERDLGKWSEDFNVSADIPNPQNRAIFTRYKNEMEIIMKYADGDSDTFEINKSVK